MPRNTVFPIKKVAWKDWFFATRPKTLTASLIPVLAGTMLARASGASISWSIAFYALMATFCIQIGTNFANDALDFKKGADTPSRIGTMRVTQVGLMTGFMTVKQVLTLAAAFFVAAILFGIPLITHGGPYILLLLLVSISLGYLYTGGPFPLAYTGMSDLFVILFFGVISSTVCYYLQTFQIDIKPVLAGLQVGLLATAILAINNLRDCYQDRLVGKNSLAVRFGETFARWEITVALLLPFALNLIWFVWGYSYAALLPFFVFPMALANVCNIWRTAVGPVYNTFFGVSALIHMTFGLLFIFGLLLI